MCITTLPHGGSLCVLGTYASVRWGLQCVYKHYFYSFRRNRKICKISSLFEKKKIEKKKKSLRGGSKRILAHANTSSPVATAQRKAEQRGCYGRVPPSATAPPSTSSGLGSVLASLLCCFLWTLYSACTFGRGGGLVRPSVLRSTCY